jgi:hypothetical protein
LFVWLLYGTSALSAVGAMQARQSDENKTRKFTFANYSMTRISRNGVGENIPCKAEFTITYVIWQLLQDKMGSC